VKLTTYILNAIVDKCFKSDPFVLNQGCVTRGRRAKSGPVAEVLWPAERSRF